MKQYPRQKFCKRSNICDPWQFKNATFLGNKTKDWIFWGEMNFELSTTVSFSWSLLLLKKLNLEFMSASTGQVKCVIHDSFVFKFLKIDILLLNLCFMSKCKRSWKYFFELNFYANPEKFLWRTFLLFWSKQKSIDMVILRQFLDKDTLEILEKIVENVLAKSKNSIRIKH